MSQIIRKSNSCLGASLVRSQTAVVGNGVSKWRRAETEMAQLRLTLTRAWEHSKHCSRCGKMSKADITLLGSSTQGKLLGKESSLLINYIIF